MTERMVALVVVESPTLVKVPYNSIILTRTLAMRENYYDLQGKNEDYYFRYMRTRAGVAK